MKANDFFTFKIAEMTENLLQEEYVMKERLEVEGIQDFELIYFYNYRRMKKNHSHKQILAHTNEDFEKLKLFNMEQAVYKRIFEAIPEWEAKAAANATSEKETTKAIKRYRECDFCAWTRPQSLKNFVCNKCEWDFSKRFDIEIISQIKF